MPGFLIADRQAGSNSLGITGTPGTGKKSVASLVATVLKFGLLDLNSFAFEAGCAETSRDGIDVDVDKLHRALIKTGLNDRVIFGHLLPDVFKRGELSFVALLRCNPQILRKRLLARGYLGARLIENIEAELIGVSLSHALDVFGGRALGEFDSTNVDPARLSRQIVREFRSRPPRKTPWIDWTTTYDSPAKLRFLLSSESKNSALT